MENQEKLEKLEEMLRRHRESQETYLQNSDVDSACAQMENAAFRDGTLSRAEKELIAIGIAVATNNEAALEWLVKQALDHGADRAQIEDAIGVGAAMGGSAETARGRAFAEKVLDFYS